MQYTKYVEYGHLGIPQSHLAGPSCTYSFWRGVIPTSYIFTLASLRGQLAELPRCMCMYIVVQLIGDLPGVYTQGHEVKSNLIFKGKMD